MRTIKFRGRKIIDGEWVSGDLIAYPNKTTWIRPGWSSPYADNGECPGEFTLIEVDPETIGEYSGMDDSDDNEIYEGHDVFLESGGKQIKGKVIFEYGCFCIKFYPIRSERNPELKYYIDMDFCRINIIPDKKEILCRACSEVGGANLPIYHLEPECSPIKEDPNDK